MKVLINQSSNSYVFEIPLGFYNLVSYKMNKLPVLKGFGFLLLPLQLSAQFYQT